MKEKNDKKGSVKNHEITILGLDWNRVSGGILFVGCLDCLVGGTSMRYIWLLVLLIPSTLAQVHEYSTTSDTKSVTGDLDLPILHSLQFEYDPFEDGDHRFIIYYNIEMLVDMNMSGNRTFAFFLDDIQIPTCTFIYQSLGGEIIGEQGVLFLTFDSVCETEWEEGNTGPHNHTVSIQQVSSAGTPADGIMWNSNIIVNAQEVKTMSSFEMVTGLSALEFAFLIVAFVLLWWVRFVTNDLYMEILVAVLAWFLGFIWLVLYNSTLIPIQLLFSILVFFTGGYWMVRSLWEQVIKKAVKL